MTIRRKPKKSALNDFAAMIVPDRIEEAYGRVEEYFDSHLNLSFDSPEGVSGVIDELIRQSGEPVRNALYNLLCEPESELRSKTQSALGGGVKSAVGLLVPLLSAQFALAPAVALLVATLVIKALTSSGEKAVCEELAQQHRKTARRLREAEQKKIERERPKIPRRTVKRTPEYREERPAAARTRPLASAEKPSADSQKQAGEVKPQGGTVRRPGLATGAATSGEGSVHPGGASRRRPAGTGTSPQGTGRRKDAANPAPPKAIKPRRKPKSDQ